MLNAIKGLLLKIVEDIDSGNSRVSEEEGIEIVNYIKSFTDKSAPMSKYSAARYLGVSRSTFDKYVRDGVIPRGKKVAGFKEPSWMKKDLDASIAVIRKEGKHGV